jgi:hypothetical protein
MDRGVRIVTVVGQGVAVAVLIVVVAVAVLVGALIPDGSAVTCQAGGPASSSGTAPPAGLAHPVQRR